MNDHVHPTLRKVLNGVWDASIYSHQKHEEVGRRFDADIAAHDGVDPLAECPRCGREHDPLDPRDKCRESAEDRDDRITHERSDREASR